MDFFAPNNPKLTNEEFELLPLENSIYANFEESKLIVRILSISRVSFNYLKNIITTNHGVLHKYSGIYIYQEPYSTDFHFNMVDRAPIWIALNTRNSMTFASFRTTLSTI